MTANARSRSEWLALALLLVAVALPFADIVTARSAIYRPDVAQYHFPIRNVVRDLVRSGEFPAWDRLRNEGQPLAANVAYQLFYPPAWLTLVGPRVWTFNLFILTHLLIAAAGMFAFLRSRGIGTPAAWFGALTFALGGPLLSMTGTLPSLFGWAWVPWLAFYVARMTRSDATPGGPRSAIFDSAGASLAAALLWIIGEPFVLGEGIVVALLVAAFAGPRRIRNVIATIGAVICGALLAAVQVIPALDLARRSVRREAFPFDVVRRWSLDPFRATELLFPHYSGFRTALAGPPGHELAYLATLYAGVLACVLLLAGIVLRRGGWKIVIAIAGLSYVIAIGDHTPLLRLLYDARLFSSIRYPEKLIVLAIFVITVFAAHVLDQIFAGDARLARTAAVIAASAGAIALAGAAAGWSPRSGPIPGARSDWLIAAALAGIASVLFAIAIRRPRVAIIALCLFAFADLARRNGQLVPRITPQFFDAPPIVERLPGAKTARIYNQLANERVTFNAALEQVPWEVRNDLYPLYPEAWKRAFAMSYDYDETELFVTHLFRRAAERAREQGDPNWPELYMAMANVAARIVPADERAASGRSRSDPAAMSASTIVPAAAVYPRYYFADAFAPTAALVDPRGRRFSPRTAFVRGAAFRPSPGVVRSAVETASTATIDVEAAGPSLLVASVTYDRDWSATIDGHRVGIAQVNLSHQGVAVPGGRHRIEFRYRNRALPYGAAVSLATLAAMIVAIMRRRREA